MARRLRWDKISKKIAKRDLKKTRYEKDLEKKKSNEKEKKWQEDIW
jgi:hypothetical protein